MAAARFTFRLANGGVVGPVSIHGAGGPIEMRYDARSRVTRLIQRATDGKPLDVTEPKPGHVRSYVQNPTADNSEGLIDLRGATLIAVEA